MSGWVHLGGSVCLAAAGCLAGVSASRSLYRKRAVLEDVLQVLLFFKVGICTKQQTLQHLWQELCSQSQRFRVLCLQFEQKEIKQQMYGCLCEGQAKKWMRKQDIELIRQWIAELGSTDTEQEEKRIDFVQQLLHQSKEQALCAERQSAKMYLFVGICTGLAAAIVTL